MSATLGTYRQVQYEHRGHSSYFKDKFSGQAPRPGVTGVPQKRRDGESAEQEGLKERKKERKEGANGKIQKGWREYYQNIFLLSRKKCLEEKAHQNKT